MVTRGSHEYTTILNMDCESPLIYYTTKTSVYSNQGGECTRVGMFIPTVHMRCAQLADTMYMRARDARTDLIYRNALRLSEHLLYVVPMLDNIPL